MKSRRWCLLLFIVLCGVVVQAYAANSPAAPLHISITPVVYIGLPIWAEVDRRPEKTGNYPYSASNLSDSGHHQLELRTDNQAVPPSNFAIPIVVFAGRLPRQPWPIEQTTDASIRLPLHALFAIDKPGRYALRWTEFGGRCVAAEVGQPWCHIEQKEIATSDWIDFEVAKAPAQVREDWLRAYLASEPAESNAAPNQWADGYLPDLLAGLPDIRVLTRLAERTYAKQGFSATAAEAALSGADGIEARRAIQMVMGTRGPNEALAQWADFRPLPVDKD